jgi:tetratricopeptide (TPR) repeat protein
VEPLTAVLMRALHAAGRDAEALERYADIQHRLAETLGTDPGPELQHLHQAILRGDLAPPASAGPPTPAAVVPAQLPPDVAGFTGRGDELKALDAVAAEGDQQATAVIVATISGTAGVGKTSLAVHWAHQVRDRFPDGQLYVDLRGFGGGGGGGAEPHVVVRGFLAALGLPPERVPSELDAQVGIYRSLLADRRMLVLLDNVRDADQVRPLLPGAPGCLVVVTSRNQLAGLVAAHGARPLALDLLSHAEATELLSRRLGPERIAAEPAAVDRIIASCARLPLALAIVAARAMTYPQFPLATLADELHDPHHGLDPFTSADSAVDIRSVFSWSYQRLSPGAAGLFRLLGLHVGPDISVPAAACLAGVEARQARRLLAELVDAWLVAEPSPGRYACHDLLRAYARDLVTASETEDDRTAAILRLHHWYLRSVRTASELLHPAVVRLPLPPLAVSGLTWGDDVDAATDWLAQERDNLLACIVHPTEDGSPEVAWLLADALRYYFLSLNDRAAWAKSAEAGLAAAREAGDPAAQAAMEHALGAGAYIWADYRGAVVHYQRGLPLASQGGDPLRAAALHASLGDVRVQIGQIDAALVDFEQAYALRREAGEPIPANLVCSLAGGCLEAGRVREAIEHCRVAWRLARDGHVAAIILEEVADAYRYLGELTRARRYAKRAVELARALTAPGLEAEAVYTLCRVLADGGDPRGAAAHARRMLTLAQDIEDERLAGYARLALVATGERGDPGRAVAVALDAIATARRLPSHTLEAAALIALAQARIDLGEYDRARDAARSAVELAASAGYRLAEGTARTTLAAAEQAAGQYTLAAGTAAAALRTHRATGYRLGEARAQVVLGKALAGAGDPAAAMPHWRAALETFTAMGTPEAEQVMVLL